MILGWGGGKKKGKGRGEWRQKSGRPWGQAAQCPQSLDWCCCRVNGPAFIVSGFVLSTSKGCHISQCRWHMNRTSRCVDVRLEPSRLFQWAWHIWTLLLRPCVQLTPVTPQIKLSTISLMASYRTRGRTMSGKIETLCLSDVSEAARTQPVRVETEDLSVSLIHQRVYC